ARAVQLEEAAAHAAEAEEESGCGGRAAPTAQPAMPPHPARHRRFRAGGRVLSATYQVSHAAFSTIHMTRSAKSMPACRAMSGTSEVGVIPGCVLTSRRIIRPGSPLVSS